MLKIIVEHIFKNVAFRLVSLIALIYTGLVLSSFDGVKIFLKMSLIPQKYLWIVGLVFLGCLIYLIIVFWNIVLNIFKKIRYRFNRRLYLEMILNDFKHDIIYDNEYENKKIRIKPSEELVRVGIIKEDGYNSYYFTEFIKRKIRIKRNSWLKEMHSSD